MANTMWWKERVLNRIELEDYLQQHNGAQVSYPFGADVKVYKVMDKMFALVFQSDTAARVNLKASPGDVEVLVDGFWQRSSQYGDNATKKGLQTKFVSGPPNKEVSLGTRITAQNAE